MGVLVLAVTGCSALPSQPTRPALYDFGPGAVAPASVDRRAPLPPLALALALADVEAPGLPEGSNAVYYRLAYTDGQQLRPYSQARWSQPPAQLVQQRLREQLGQRRAILKADDGAALARDSARGGALPLVLRVELEEFSQLFSSPGNSVAAVRMRATLVDLTPAGEVLRGQKVFVAQVPARSADAVGGVQALSEAATQCANELSAWIDAASAP